jgi:hypothetical protein
MCTYLEGYVETMLLRHGVRGSGGPRGRECVNCDDLGPSPMDTPMFEESKNVDSGDPIGTLVQNKRFNSVWSETAGADARAKSFPISRMPRSLCGGP